jgi:hypothetical protein
MRLFSFVKNLVACFRGPVARSVNAGGIPRHGPWRRSVVLASLAGAIGLVLLLVRGALGIPDTAAEALFVIVHPLHVFIAAATLVRLLSRPGRLRPLVAAAVGYPLVIAIVTTVDSLLPYLAELLLALPSRHVHIGFVEFWWLVHPLAITGTAAGLAAPRLRLRPRLVLAASLLPPVFDMMMAMWKPLDPAALLTIALFTGLSVWTYLLALAAAAAGVSCLARAASGPRFSVDRYLATMVSDTGVDPAGVGWYSWGEPCRNRRRTGSSSSRPR